MKALFKFKIYWLISAVIVFSSFILANDCLVKEMKKAFELADEMNTYRRGDTICPYKITPAAEIQIKYESKNLLVPAGITFIATYSKADYNILEVVVISGKSSDVYKTYVFVNGQEIRELVTKLNREDYFRVRVLRDGRIIFNFHREVNSFASYNPATSEFCYGQADS